MVPVPVPGRERLFDGVGADGTAVVVQTLWKWPSDSGSSSSRQPE